MPIPETQKLGRNLGFFPIFAIGTGTMIGAGIFVLPGIATANAGPAAILSFILGGMISMATAISMAELATGMPRAGGTYYFISRAMGALFGAIIGIGAWLALVFKGSFALIGLAEYLKALVPIPILVTAITAGILLLIINYRGAESSGKLQNGIVIGLFVILLSFIIRGSLLIEPGKFEPLVPYGVSSIFITTGIIFVSYLGITQLAALSEEVRDPAKNLPRAFIASVGAVTLLYAGVMLIVNGILPLEDIIATTTPLVDAGELLAGRAGGLLIILAGFFATVSTANAAILSSSRFPFAMSRDNLIPAWFTDVHQDFHTPYRAIAVTGGVMLILLLLFDVEGLARLGSAFNILIFVLVNISVIILRNTEHKWYSPDFRDPLYPFTQIFGIAASLMLLPQVGTLPAIFAVSVIILGTIWYFAYGAQRAQPQYNFLDKFESQKIPVSPDERKKRVLVSVANPEHEEDLLHLADCLGDRIFALNVIQVPPQISPHAAQEDYEKHKGDHHNLLREGLENYTTTHQKKEYKFVVAFDHSVPHAIMEEAEEEQTDLIVLGWQRINRLHSPVGGVANTVLRQARCHVAVLKGHFPEDLTKITVPFGGGNNARYALYLAKRIALATGAEIEVLRVVSPDSSEEQKQEIIRELKEIVEETSECRIDFTIWERFSVIDALLEASASTELMVIGDSNERLKRAYLGRVPMRVTKHSEGPMLIVRRFRPVSTENIRSLLRNKKRNRPPAEQRARTERNEQ